MGESTSRLLNLPAGLRNKINRLSSQTASWLMARDDVEDYKMIPVNANGYERPGLVQTCKRTRLEALKIFYYENVFFVDTSGGDSDTLLKWTITMRNMRPAIKKIMVVPDFGQASLFNWKHFKVWAHRGAFKDTPKSQVDSGNKSTAAIAILKVLWIAF